MKKQIYILGFLLACLLSVGLSSCSSDDNGGDSPTPPTPLDIADIVGTWNCTSSVDIFQGISEQSLMVGKQFTLTDNGTFTCSSPHIGNSGTYTLAGNILTTQSAAGTSTIAVNITGGNMHWSGSCSDGSTFEYDLSKVANDGE